MLSNIRDLLRAQPFIPFTIVTSSGKHYRVLTPDHASVAPGGDRAVVWADDGHMYILSPPHIAGLELDQTPAEA